MYFVYILYSAKCDKFYVGHTDAIDRRLYEHNHSKGGKFSKGCAPWVVVYSEQFSTRVEAVKRELEIKKRKSRKYIQMLITSTS